jgi:hypothetical protein
MVFPGNSKNIFFISIGIALLLLQFPVSSNAQKNKQEQIYLDSLLNLLTPAELDSLNLDLDIFSNTKQKSGLDISLQFANGTLSKTDKKGNSVNHSKLINTFLASYTLKSGLGISYENNSTTALNKLTVLQHAVSLFYDYPENEKLEFGFNVNKNFRKDSIPFDVSQFDYEFGSSFCYSKPFIEPIVLLSYSTGNYTEKIVRPLTTIEYKVSINDFSVIAGVQHQYYFEKLLSEKDQLYLVPRIMLINAAQHYKTFNPTRNKFTQRLMNNGFISRSISSTFQPQSLGAELESDYSFGKGYLGASIYLDYYLHTASKRFNAIFGLTLGVRF